MIAATDIADLLVRRGVPFRQSHGIVAGIVREALASGRALSDLSRDELARHSEALDDEFYDVLAQQSLARVQGLRGRHGARARARAAQPRPRGARGPARVSGGAAGGVLRPARWSRWRATWSAARSATGAPRA